jgi:hypothetical protein
VGTSGARRVASGTRRVTSGRCAKVLSSVRAVSSIVISQRGSTLGASTSESSTNSLWLAAESIRALLAAGEGTSLALELIHGDGRESGSSVVLSLVLVNLMDWDGGVDDRWLDSLLLDDWLDRLVDVVVDVLACNVGTGCGVLSLANCAGVLELSGLGI